MVGWWMSGDGSVKVLVAGYGNPLRGDDGVGQYIALKLSERFPQPQVECVASHQLMPEVVEAVSRAGFVLFIDADATLPAGKANERKVEPLPDAGAFTHHVTPAGLLAGARALYGVYPPALLVSVGVADFEYGESLSPAVVAALPALTARLAALIERELDM
jgi:hydrogenase maturation protease